jgi:hypothetical protein
VPLIAMATASHERVEDHVMASKKPSGLAALSALREKLPTGPAVTAWLVASRDGTPHGWLAVTRFRQTIGALADRDLSLPGALVDLALIEDGAITLEVTRFNITAADKDGGRVEDPQVGPSLRVDGRAIRRVGERVTITPASRIRVGDYELALAAAQPSIPAKPVAAPAAKPNRDLILHQPRKHAGDLAIDGWLEITGGGRLACTGTVRCRGVIVEDGGALSCRELVTNYLHVDGGTLEAAAIRTRVLYTVQLALAKLIERGVVTADFQIHFGGELNPSFDDARGTNPLRADLYAVHRDDRIEPDLRRIRDASNAGEQIFDGCEPLV